MHKIQRLPVRHLVIGIASQRLREPLHVYVLWISEDFIDVSEADGGPLLHHERCINKSLKQRNIMANHQQRRTLLGEIPVDYIEAASVIPLLQERIDTLTRAKDEAMGHVDAAQSAGDPVSAGLEWLRAAAAAKATYDAGVLVKDSLGELVGSTDGDIGDAFQTAPRCANVDLG